jgi:hypothetical protein
VTANAVGAPMKMDDTIILQSDGQCVLVACYGVQEVKEDWMGGACSMTVNCDVKFMQRAWIRQKA